MVSGQHALLVTCPQTKHFHDVTRLDHLKNKPVLNVDMARIGAREITNQFFVRGRILVGIAFDDLEQFLRLFLRPGCCELLSVFLGLLGIDELPSHQSNSFEQESRGSSMPAMMDSRMPGMESRNSVS